MRPYGKELILDLHDCDPETFTRVSIARYFEELCAKIGMQREDLFWWDDVGVPEEERQTEPHLVGTSAIQFIKTSNVTIHTLDIMRRVYLNVFSCKDFDAVAAVRISMAWFGGRTAGMHVIERI